MKRRTLSLALLLLPAACVSQGPESRLGTQERAEQAQRVALTRTSDCVYQSSIDSFDSLDERHVVLFADGRRRAYLAEVTGACFSLDSQVSLVTVDGDGNGQVCGYGRDSVAFRGMGRVENCRILGLEELSGDRRLELGLAEIGRPGNQERGATEPSEPAKPQ